MPGAVSRIWLLDLLVHSCGGVNVACAASPKTPTRSASPTEVVTEGAVIDLELAFD